MLFRRKVPQILELPTGDLPLEVARHPRAKHITVRLNRRGDGVRLVLPPRASLREGLRFARSKAGWIEARLGELPPTIPFVDGVVLPILGEDHVVRHLASGRRGVWREAGTIQVSGRAEHLPRRVADFLKTEARGAIAPRARAKAAVLGRTPGRITLRDTKSRWGSCSPDGNLNFSWRLILAPEAVLDYVVAHEVAHLIELNHGPRFWKLTARLTPEVKGPRSWLRHNDERLLRYG
jgi:predicted metal-dependent hydrolase